MKFQTSLVLALSHIAYTMNVGPDYQHRIEGSSTTRSRSLHTLLTSIDLDKDLPFSQPVTFAHLEWQRCLSSAHTSVESRIFHKNHASFD